MTVVNKSGVLRRSGKRQADRGSGVTVLGIEYIGTEGDRLESLAEAGVPADGGLEVVPAGIQRARWAPEFTEAVNSVEGEVEAGPFWISLQLRASAYNRKSNPGPVTFVNMAPAWAQNTVYAVGDFVTAPIGVNKEGAGAALRIFEANAISNPSSNSGTEIEDFNTDEAKWDPVAPNEIRIDDGAFIEPADNTEWEEGYADRVVIGRTLASDADVASLVDTDRDIDPQVEGQFFPALEVPIHSFRTYDTWATGTPYFVDARVQAVIADGGVNFTRRFLCQASHVSGGTDIEADIAANPSLWLQIGESPIFLQKADDEIGSSTPFSVRRNVPPDCWSLAVIGDRVYFTGQRDYSVTVSVTKDGSTINIGTGAVALQDAFPTGIVGREILVGNDPKTYVVTDWVSRTQIIIDRPYEGITQVSTDAVVRAGIGHVFFSEAELGTPLADAFALDNVMVYRPESGRGNEAVIPAPLGGFVIQRDSIGYFSQSLDEIREIEAAGFRTKGTRNVATGERGEVFIMCDDGIRMYDGPRAGRLITEPVRDWWNPSSTTQWHWNAEALDRGVMVFDKNLHRLLVLAPIGDETIVRMGLMYDMDSDNASDWNWTRIELWADSSAIPQGQSGVQKVFPDITSAESSLIDGRYHVVLGGKILVDTSGDGTGDLEHLGRLMIYGSESGRFASYVDQLPHDKATGVLDHGIPWKRQGRPVVGKAGQKVTVNSVRVFIRPITDSTSAYDVRMSVQHDFDGGVDLNTTVRGRYSRSGEPLAVRTNLGTRVSTALSGVSRDQESHGVFEEYHQFVRSMGKGSRT